MNAPLTTETVGPRTAHARKAFTAWFKREPEATEFDARWIGGYVAALEDLPDEALASLGLS